MIRHRDLGPRGGHPSATMTPVERYQKVNLANWNSRVPHHAQSYGLHRFRSDPAHLTGAVRFDLPRLGSIEGLDVVHLQCHIGTDTLSLARLGARTVSGLDFSSPALAVAAQLAVDCGATSIVTRSTTWSSAGRPPTRTAPPASPGTSTVSPNGLPRTSSGLPLPCSSTPGCGWEGLTDAEAQQLPTPIDGFTLRQMEISTWRIDGDFDVLADIPDENGRHLGFEDLTPRSATVSIGDVAIRIAALEDVIASKEWANRTKDRDALPELHAHLPAQDNPERPAERTLRPPVPSPGAEPNLGSQLGETRVPRIRSRSSGGSALVVTRLEAASVEAGRLELSQELEDGSLAVEHPAVPRPRLIVRRRGSTGGIHPVRP